MEKKTNVSQFPTSAIRLLGRMLKQGKQSAGERGRRVCQWPLEHVGYFCFLSCN